MAPLADNHGVLQCLHAQKRQSCHPYLVRVGEGMAIHAVVRGVELAFKEPGNVAVLQTAMSHSVKGFGPREKFSR